MNRVDNNHQNHMMQGALVLSIAAFITKVLSALYKVPFQNLTGDEGFYVYQQIYPLYGIAVALSLNGLPLFVSKIIAEEKERSEQQVVIKLIGVWLIIVSFILFAFFWLGAGWIAGKMGDAELFPVIRSVSYIYLFIPFLSSIRGFFQGNLDMLPTGISQVGEQVARITVLLGAAYLYTLTDWTVYEMGSLALASSWIAGIVGSVILFWYVFKRTESMNLNKTFDKQKFLKIGRRLIIEGLPLTAMSSMMVLFQLLDSFTVYNGLIDSGISERVAMSTKGIYDRGQPFVQLGLVIGLGISTSALPLLRKYSQENKKEEWEKISFTVLNLTLLFSGAASVGLIVIMPWLNHALFSDEAGTGILQVYVVSILLASLVTSTHSILQSETNRIMPVISLLAGLIFKASMNQLAVRYIGIMGSSYLTIISLIVVLLLMNNQMPKNIWTKFLENRKIFKIITLLILMGGLTYLSLEGLTLIIPDMSRMLALVLTLIGTTLGSVAFIFGLIYFNLLSEQEWQYIPFRNKIDRFISK
ncbi:putative polysaccharide biosynthesis protein [Marinilactibacillus sp. 15R]|uniref:putative polysaccharide biosynthesis protein n=1 Tax=Marinilactibacillus sp. 15R TaxID=1911586 RepID=UPI0009FB1420|nr:polysaccharide biosynthesis protein [Marinilactibacillus sp. 15R]